MLFLSLSLGIFLLWCMLVREPLHYVAVPPQQFASEPFTVSAWAPLIGQRNLDDYIALLEKYSPYTNGNKFLTILQALESVTTRNISLLTTNVSTWQLVGISRDTMKEVLKSLQIQPKVLTRKSNAMWKILLANKEEAKKLAGRVLTNKSV